MTDSSELKDQILSLTRQYVRNVHSAYRPGTDPDREPWEPSRPIPYAGRVFAEEEVVAAVSSTLKFWLTLGEEGDALQNELAEFLGVRHCLLVNSGSSANLIAISALTSSKLPDSRRIKRRRNNYCSCGISNNCWPIVQAGAVPVFIDADPIIGNAECSQLEEAYSPENKGSNDTHALGNPFDLATTLQFCRKYNSG